MLHLHLSNRTTALASMLAATMRAAPLPLLETECVVVPSSALARWLEFRIADELGIAAQLAFPFPAAFAWQLFGRLLPEVAHASPFDRAAMQWRLVRLLQGQGAAEIRHYLADDDGSKSHALAQRLAGLFEQYLVERPDWIAAWSARQLRGLGPDEDWQAELWRQLVAELPGVASEHPRDRFLARLRQDRRAAARLPARISLFAVEAMPALYWDTFVALAEIIEVHVFALSPSREYWGDLARLRTKLRMELEQPGAAGLYDVGHPLLASLGRGRRHAVMRLAEAGAQLAASENLAYVEPPASLLGSLQRDMLDLSVNSGTLCDDSLQIHDCHGPLREAEVLGDRLLALFETLPDLQPSDILILTPDIETYGPLVEAVLMHAEAKRRLPCALADRAQGQSDLWRTLVRLCQTAAGEVDAESVLALMEEPMLRRAFAIDGDDLPMLRDWVAAASIRHGVGTHADATFDHSWRAGLQRLLIGAAMPDEERLYRGVLPVEGIEGSRSALLGRFVDYAEAVFACVEKVSVGKTAPEWCALLGELLERFFAPDEAEESQAQRLRECLATLARQAGDAGCELRLPLAVMLEEIDAALAERASVRAFHSGKVTIAALQPGRPLPARVICCVGMNDGAWPRPTVPLGFDLLARHPRAGDRNRRDEERHAFLEMLLCAGERLLITYTGRDPRSNLDYPPAAPLAELIDTLSAMTGQAGDQLVIKHPLQPFSPLYFNAQHPRLASYERDACPPVTSVSPTPFLTGLPDMPMADVGNRVELAELLRFLAHPVRHFLREQLGIHLEESEELLEIHEPFVANRLEAYQLREKYFAALREGKGEEEVHGLLVAHGWLPHGVAGDLASAAARAEAVALLDQAADWLAESPLPACEASFAAEAGELVGRLDGLTARGLWRVRHGKIRPVDRLRLWVEHLLLHVAGQPALPRHSVLFALDGVVTFGPLGNAQACLADLLALYREGRQAPLPFYPNTAWAWLERKSSWQTAWTGNRYRKIPGEAEDPYLRLALRDQPDDPLGEAFQVMAARVFGPMRKAGGDD